MDPSDPDGIFRLVSRLSWLVVILILAAVRASTRSSGKDSAPPEPPPVPELVVEKFRELVHSGRTQVALTLCPVRDMFPHETPNPRALHARVVEALSEAAASTPSLASFRSALVEADDRCSFEELDRIGAAMLRTLEAESSAAERQRQAPLAERPQDLAKVTKHREQAEAHATAGRLDEACYDLERAVALDPGSAELKARLAELEKRRDVEKYRAVAARNAASGKPAEAIEALERLLRADPADEAARRELERLRAS